MEKSKVAVVACPDYEPARVKESLQKGLEAIGGLESLIGKEENILLKPNLVRSAKRERAVVTDPEVMDALITILQENGYEHISCGDSCAASALFLPPADLAIAPTATLKPTNATQSTIKKNTNAVLPQSLPARE